MPEIQNEVLPLDEIAVVTDHYYTDDIIVDQHFISTEEVVVHLLKYELRVKDSVN